MSTPSLKTLILTCALLLVAFGAAACGGAAAATPPPTPDLNPLRTEVAATVLAQVPALCALTPTATLQPTATLEPTATIAVPSETPTLAITLTPVTTVGEGTPTETEIPGDKAAFVSQTVQDGTRFTPGETFTMVWRLKNVGVTTWTAGYRLRFFAGDAFGAPQEIQLPNDVGPNQEVDITLQMKAPAKTGKYTSSWVMSNENRYNFKEPVYLEIEVALPPTATVTPTVQPTPTNTPSQ